MINPFNGKDDTNRVIMNWSGGVSSAVAGLLALELYGSLHFAFLETNRESEETYRFLEDYEQHTGVKINRYQSTLFNNPDEVWEHDLAFIYANGARCSSELKRQVSRSQVADKLNDYGQVFGFDYTAPELKRATSMIINMPELNGLFPLQDAKMNRSDVFKYLAKVGLKAPKTYIHFANNNCLGKLDSPIGGCVRGAVGYWQAMREHYPHKYEYMGRREHEITALKKAKMIADGTYTEDSFMVATMNKDQRSHKRVLKRTKKGELKKVYGRLFLLHNPEHPEVETIDAIPGKQPSIPIECNGLCDL